ncbi:hypothetical protein D3C84_274790 [compost metagenome]
MKARDLKSGKRRISGPTLVATSSNNKSVPFSMEWFTKPPKPKRPALTMADEKGQVTNVKLKDGLVVGSW